MSVDVCSFYLFKRIEQSEWPCIQRALLIPFGQDMRGSILVGHEGINATVSGQTEVVTRFQTAVSQIMKEPIHFKLSVAKEHPFKRFKLCWRREIVTFGRPYPVPMNPTDHLSPQAWHSELARAASDSTIVVDVRNRHEVAIGQFRGAIQPGIERFRDFPERFAELNLPKEKKVLLYCTGGIRCEKAALEVRAQGYSEVYQLSGGIIEYLRQYPNGLFDGECFVFDDRVALTQHLAPSRRYCLCPHCGQPVQERIPCDHCIGGP